MLFVQVDRLEDELLGEQDKFKAITEEVTGAGVATEAEEEEQEI